MRPKLDGARIPLGGFAARRTGTCRLARTALLAAAGRALPHTALQAPETPIQAGEPRVVRLETAATRPTSALVRIQDDLENIVLLETGKLGPDGRLNLPGLPGTHNYFVDVLLRGTDRECLGFASTVLPVAGTLQFNSLALAPSRRVHRRMG